jgi:diguanylate cyclase
MTKRSLTDWFLVVPMTVAALFFAGRVLWPQAGGFAGIDDLTSLRVAGLVKLAFLLAGGTIALSNAARLGSGNVAQPAWQGLALGLLASAAGQAVLWGYQLSPRGAAPFPSLADVFFIVGYPLFIAALIGFLRAYGATGYPLGSARQRLLLSGLVGAVGLALAVLILHPVLLKPGVAPLARFLNSAYPVLDVVLLVPVALLLRATLPLRGGEVWKVWAALLAGFACMWAGDVLFALFDALNVQSVDPLTHAMYVLSYGSLALGVVRQHRLLTS